MARGAKHISFEDEAAAAADPGQRWAALSLRQLRVLLAVADHGGVTKAAEATGLVQAAVSRSIAEIETILGSPVLSRGARAGLLSDLGESAVGAARKVTAEITALADDVMITRYRAGSATIGVSGVLENPILARAASEVHAACDGATLRFISAPLPDLFDRLRQATLDLVVTRKPLELATQGLAGIVMRREQTKVLATAGLPILAKGNCSWAEMMLYPWILPHRGLPERDRFDQLLDELKLEAPKNYIEVNNVFLLEEFLPGLRGFAFCPRAFGDYLVAAGIAADTGAVLYNDDRPLSMFWNKLLPIRPMARLFRDTLLAAGENSPAPEPGEPRGDSHDG
jgi:DNA-binding transcriptional LysR family regulator